MDTGSEKLSFGISPGHGMSSSTNANASAPAAAPKEAKNSAASKAEKAPSQAEEKPWHEGLNPDDVKKWRETHEKFSSNYENFIKEKSSFEKEREEFKKSREAESKKELDSKFASFKELQFEDKFQTLYEKLSAMEGKHVDKEGFSKYEKVLQRLATVMLVNDIKSAVKAEDDVDITDQQIGEVSREFMKRFGRDPKDQDEFLFAYRAMKNSVSKEMHENATEEGRQKAHEEISKKKAELKPVSLAYGSATQSKGSKAEGHFATRQERSEAIKRKFSK